VLVFAKGDKEKEAQEMYNRALKIDDKNISLQKKLEEIKKKK
jgi:hypothetical protein